MICSDLDFEPDLHDLCGGHAEISRREVGVEMHRREEPLAPDCHPGHVAIGDDHHPAKIIGDLLRIDAAQGRIAASQPQPVHDIGMFHKSEMKGDPGNAGADRNERHALGRINARRIGADGREQQDTLVQNAIVPQVMRQPKRYARACCSEDRGGPRQADRPVLEHPSDKLVLSLP